MHNPLCFLPGIISEVAQHPPTETAPLEESSHYLVLQSLVFTEIFSFILQPRDIGNPSECKRASLKQFLVDKTFSTYTWDTSY